MFESTVKAVQRDLYVAQVRGIVCYFAYHLKLLVTYGDIAAALKSTPRGGQLAQALAAITEADHKEGNPPSTAVVVNKHAGRPGAGFFVQCRNLGFPVGASESNEETFWMECLRRLKVAPYTLGDEPEEPEPEKIGPKGDPEFQRRHTEVIMALEGSSDMKASTMDSGLPRGKATPRVSLNVKKRPLDAPDSEEVLRARLKQADKAGWIGSTKAESEAKPEVEPVGHSQLPGDV